MEGGRGKKVLLTAGIEPTTSVSLEETADSRSQRFVTKTALYH